MQTSMVKHIVDALFGRYKKHCILISVTEHR